ncbi:MAG: hypothetical protein FWB71_06515 [Defluviitaleaceae bacterium]|nr:hypothetical protein [Defluviitaleaceae bacterium]
MIKLDHLGQFYSAANCEKNPGTFGIGVHLNEDLIPELLQRAANDLMRRLPHLNTQEYRGFLHYFHKMRNGPIKIEKQGRAVPCRHFKKGGPLLRIIYGRRHFALVVLHSVCDGRSLAMAASSLLIRYCELLAINVNKSGFIDCAGRGRAAETEDAYARHADMRKSKSEKGRDVYIPAHRAAAPRIYTYKFDLRGIKPRAKALGMTISEYILAHIFREFARQRAKEGGKKAITCSIPIDCRAFFPSDSLKCFVTHKIIKMPETWGFAGMARGIKKQFAEITPDYIQNNISEMEQMIRLGNFVPLFIKKWIIRGIGRGATAGCSTAFSNLGLIQLPEEIRGKVSMYTFMLGAEAGMPYQFACVATGDVLTLTATVAAKDIGIVRRICRSLGAREDCYENSK